jgi:hypothetical protein
LLKRLFKPREISHIPYFVLRKTVLYLGYLYYRIFRPSRTFTLGRETYRYFIHRHKMTWRTERSLEIPIVRRIMEEYRGRSILEVGNVLSHYFPCTHDVLDKYEKADGVVNEDIVDYRPAKRYDLIASISTLEHVGWDEQPRNPVKVLDAFENLRNLLAPGGRIVITFPLGYNPALERLLREGKIQFTRQFCLKRVTASDWKQVDCNRIICRARYGYHSFFATGLFIGIIES